MSDVFWDIEYDTENFKKHLLNHGWFSPVTKMSKEELYTEPDDPILFEFFLPFLEGFDYDELAIEWLKATNAFNHVKEDFPKLQA
jgi:hypothetical protein